MSSLFGVPSLLLAFALAPFLMALFHQFVQIRAVLAVTFLPIQKFPTVLRGPETGPQRVAIYCEAIHRLYGHVGVLCLLKGQVRTVDQRAVAAPGHLGLCRNLTDNDALKFPILAKEFRSSQYVHFGNVER